MENNLIIQDDLKTHIRSLTGMFTDDGFYISIDAVLNAIDFAQTVEVVRCKDCEHWDTDWCPSTIKGVEHWCGMIDLVTGPDFFCGHGERKKEDAAN